MKKQLTTGTQITQLFTENFSVFLRALCVSVVKLQNKIIQIVQV